MNAYKFTNTEDNKIFIIDETSFETINACETHSGNGNLVGCYDAGCYSLANSASDCSTDLFNYLCENNSNLSEIYQETESPCFTSIDELEGEIRFDFTEYHRDEATPENLLERVLVEINETIIEIITLAKSWIKENENHIEIKALNIWDGSNNKTPVVLTSEYGHGESYQHATELDESESLEYIKAYEDLIQGTHLEGSRLEIECSNFTISTSRFSDDWAAAWIEVN